MVEKIDRDLLSEAIPLKSGESLIFSEISFCHFKVHVVAHKIHSEKLSAKTKGVTNIWLPEISIVSNDEIKNWSSFTC